MSTISGGLKEHPCDTRNNTSRADMRYDSASICDRLHDKKKATLTCYRSRLRGIYSKLTQPPANDEWLLRTEEVIRLVNGITNGGDVQATKRAAMTAIKTATEHLMKENQDDQRWRDAGKAYATAQNAMKVAWSVAAPGSTQGQQQTPIPDDPIEESETATETIIENPRFTRHKRKREPEQENDDPEEMEANPTPCESEIAEPTKPLAPVHCLRVDPAERREDILLKRNAKRRRLN